MCGEVDKSTRHLGQGGIDGGLKAVGVLASRRGEEGLTATAAANVDGQFADHEACMQVALSHHIVADRDGEGHLATGAASEDAKEGGVLRFQLEGEVLDVLGIQVQDGATDLNAVDVLELSLIHI